MEVDLAGVVAGAAAGVVEAGAEVVLAPGAAGVVVVAFAGVDEAGVEAFAAAGVVAAGAELSEVDFLDLEDFLAVEEASAEAAEVSAVSAFFDFVAFLEDEVSAAVELSAFSVFLGLEVDFLEVEASAELSAASAFLLLEDFLVEDVSAAACSEASAFFDFEDLEEAEESEVASSVVFFFLLDFLVVSVWLWSEGCVCCGFDAALKVRLPAHRNRAATTARKTELLRKRFIVERSFRRPGGCAHLACTRAMCGGLEKGGTTQCFAGLPCWELGE